MGDRGDNKASPGKGQGSIVMGAGPTAVAVRNHHQRELRSGDCSVGCDRLTEAAERLRYDRRITGILDGNLEWSVVGIGYHDPLKADRTSRGDVDREQHGERCEGQREQSPYHVNFPKDG
jgi:hypothetical protein